MPTRLFGLGQFHDNAILSVTFSNTKIERKNTMNDQLNHREQRFCEEWMLAKGNATAAAIQVGYSPASARARASELMKKSAVQDYIADLQAEQAIRCSVDSTVLMRQLVDMACGGATATEYEFVEIRRGTSPESQARYKKFAEHSQTFIDSGEMVVSADRMFLKIPKCAKTPNFDQRLKAIDLLARLTGAFTTASLTAKEGFKRRLSTETAVLEAELREG